MQSTTEEVKLSVQKKSYSSFDGPVDDAVFLMEPDSKQAEYKSPSVLTDSQGTLDAPEVGQSPDKNIISRQSKGKDNLPSKSCSRINSEVDSGTESKVYSDSERESFGEDCTTDTESSRIRDASSLQTYLSTDDEGDDKYQQKTKRIKLTSAVHSEQLLKLDTMSNVSPDSGIQSIGGSPSGNESPNSVTNGEHLSTENQMSEHKKVDCGPALVSQETVTQPLPVSDKIVETNIRVEKVAEVVKTFSSGKRKRGRPPKRKFAFLQHRKSKLYNMDVTTNENINCAEPVAHYTPEQNDEYQVNTVLSSTASRPGMLSEQSHTSRTNDYDWHETEGTHSMITSEPNSSSENDEPLLKHNSSRSTCVPVAIKKNVKKILSTSKKSLQKRSSNLQGVSQKVYDKRPVTTVDDISDNKRKKSEKHVERTSLFDLDIMQIGESNCSLNNVHKDPDKIGSSKKLNMSAIESSLEYTSIKERMIQKPSGFVKRRPGRPKGSPNKSTILKQLGLIPDKLHSVKKIRGPYMKKSGLKAVKKSDKFKKTKINVKRPCGRPPTKLQTQSSKSIGLKSLARKKPFKKVLQKVSLGSKVRTDSVQPKRKPGRPRKYPISLNQTPSNTSFVVNDSDLGSRLKVGERLSPSGSEFDTLIQSVQDSINSQFQVRESDHDEIHDLPLEDSLSAIEPTLTTGSSEMCIPSKETKPKPKIRKPKLHVMMRKHKKRRRKKLLKPPADTTAETSSDQISRSKTVSTLHVGKTPKPPSKSAPSCIFQSSTGSLSLPKIPFASPVAPSVSSSSFGSKFQQMGSFSGTPFLGSDRMFKGFQSSKMLKTQSGLGIVSPGSFRTPSDGMDDFSKLIDKRKKKKRLLYFKSKHKNILDPTFEGNLQTMVHDLDRMAISEHPGDNFIRVRPGEVLLPSIFRLSKINVKKKKKEKLILEKVKKKKSTKDQILFKEFPLPLEKPRGPKKKSFSVLDDPEPPILERQITTQQCLPPKKRHKLMNMPSSLQAPTLEPVPGSPLPEKRKPGRPRKHPVQQDAGK